ncbi:uncharacterized protein LOC126379689 [Pectinophora gossypiella]|uniref:uncharacterized protein LOC126379689 n=1 Tax=Pectinophora gossypiella TaxID=13191 RepID=UPI00214F0068|nr:uncharacterized protein LOC126379689 [Pectinophora gossypiella]
MRSTEATLNIGSVNVALETVLEFEKKDIPSDVKVLDRVQKFLARVRSILNESMDTRRSDRRDRIKFTDFVENALIILRSFSDEDLEELVVVVDDELRKYHYKGCKFYELVQNDDLRSYVTTNLELMRATPAKHLKTYIANAQKKLQNKSFNDEENAFIEYINSLYSGNTSETMYNILQNLQQYNTASKRSTTGLQKIVKDAIRSVVFDHYSNLNVNARRDLRIKVATYLIDYYAKDKKMNSTIVRFSTEKVDYEAVTPVTPDRNLVETLKNKLSPFRELTNESVTNLVAEAKTPYRPIMTLFPEDITMESKPLKKRKKRGKRKMTSPMPMQTLWEEENAARKKSVEDQPKTKKTKQPKVHRKDKKKPLKEIKIFSEQNAIINVGSTKLPATGASVSKKKKHKHRHRHGKRHKSKKIRASTDKTTAESKVSTEKKSTIKMKTSKEKTASKEDLIEKTTKVQPIRKAIDKSVDIDGLSIEMFPRRFLSDKHKAVLSKRSQIRRDELRLKRRSRNITLSRFLTTKHAKLKRRFKTITRRVSTPSTTDTNFILKKINNLEKELENVKHRMYESTSTTGVTVTTDLPLWERNREKLKTTNRVTTSTTEPSDSEEVTEKSVTVTKATPKTFTTAPASKVTAPITKKITITLPRNGTLANISVPSTTVASSTKLTTNSTLTTPTPTTVPPTTTTPMIATIVFRSSDNSTFLPVILHKNETIAKQLKPVIEFAENEDINEVTDNLITKQNEFKYNETEILKKGKVKFEIKEKKDANLSLYSKNTTRKDLKSTLKETVKKTTSKQEVQTLPFFSLHKTVNNLTQNDNIKSNIKLLNKTRILNFSSPDCDAPGA